MQDVEGIKISSAIKSYRFGVEVDSFEQAALLGGVATGCVAGTRRDHNEGRS